MKAISSIHSDPHSNLMWTFDAVHGSIDVRDATNSDTLGVIVRLLATPVIQRLRRIKQLGFAYQTYPAADHSRYAHALGTMHVMRSLFNRIEAVSGFPIQLFQALSNSFPKTFLGEKDTDRNSLLQHMLVAALLQDLGELPFRLSENAIYKPSEVLKRSVEDFTGFPIRSWEDKDVFTVACLLHRTEVFEILKEMSLPFLIFLITGKAPINLSLSKDILQLRQFIDGMVDADRLDYVYRDAYHTVGGLGTPNAVIETLLYYDEVGPVFSDPGPVSIFLATRAYMFSSVYYTPANRFKVLALAHLLKGIYRREECAKTFFGHTFRYGMSIEDFLELDDVSLFSRITDFAESKTARLIGKKSRIALDILLGDDQGYQCMWLPPQSKKYELQGKVDLPAEMFFDTYSDQYRTLFKPGSIRIKANMYKHLRDPLPIEECGGPFSAMFNPGWSVSPMPNSILIFLPYKTYAENWKIFFEGLEQGWLYEYLIVTDSLESIEIPTDTRNNRGFSKPDIFISFTWADIEYVKKLTKVLFERKRRYFLFAGPFQGIGKTPSVNSEAGVEEADVVLIVSSMDYSLRYKQEPDGYVAKEIFAMSRRIDKENKFKIIVLGLDHALDDTLPWSQLGFNGAPFIGPPLREASKELFDNAIDEVIKVVGQ